VVDAAEVVRNTHPDERWQRTADEVHQGLSSYLNTLNTEVGLYEVGIAEQARRADEVF
jgi:intermediate peptidase